MSLNFILLKTSLYLDCFYILTGRMEAFIFGLPHSHLVTIGVIKMDTFKWNKIFLRLQYLSKIGEITQQGPHQRSPEIYHNNFISTVSNKCQNFSRSKT